MIDFGLFLLTVAIGVGGAFLAKKLKIPAGSMMGAMIAVMAFNLLTGLGVFYDDLRVVVQIAAGAMIGVRMKKANIRALKKLALPVIILCAFMMVMNVSVGLAIFSVSNLDAATALFSSSPGGMSDMAIIASDLGANSAYVALLQLIRLLTIIIFMPPIFKKISARSLARGEIARHDSSPDSAESSSMKSKTERLLVTVLIGSAGGLLLRQIGVPAGAMIGSMLLVTIFSVTAEKAYFPAPFRTYTQILSGVYTGMRMDRASLLTLPELALPGLFLIVSVFVFAFMTSFVMHKLTKLPFSTSLMASTPGGLQELSILADDLGLDSPTIALLQSVRLIFVVAVFPTIIGIIIRFLA